MPDVSNFTDFNSMSPSQKDRFFDEQIEEVVKAVDERVLYRLLKSIILNSSENNYIRQKAVEAFTECVFLDKLKVRSELNILLEDWNENEDAHLELRRLKDLFLFYDEAPVDIEKTYQAQIQNDEAEIASESNYLLGLIVMQKAFGSFSRDECVENLNQSHRFFAEASNLIENRIDADFFNIVISLILDFLQEKYGGINFKIEKLARILLDYDIFSFGSKRNFFHISFYRSLLSLNKIRTHADSTNEWLNFREGLTELFYYYCEIKNSKVKSRLNQSALRHVFLEFIENNFAQPYFAKSFPAEMAKLDSRLKESDISVEQRDFLLYIKKLAENADSKKKVDESIKVRIARTHPLRTPQYINQVLSRFSDLTKSQTMMDIYELLAKPSKENLTDAIVFACTRLQGNKLFWTASEDERNTFIADFLSAKGESVKDQTRWGISHGGKTAGEIDIFVSELDGNPFAIIEALILNSLDQSYIKLHIDKLFKYDTTGLNQNFILIYSEANNFSRLWAKYVEYIKKYN